MREQLEVETATLGGEVPAISQIQWTKTDHPDRASMDLLAQLVDYQYRYRHSTYPVH
jgi:hypothetical protein